MAATEGHPDAASYAASGYGNRMGWGTRPALLLIDICKAYWTPGSPLDLSGNPAAVEVPASAARLVAAARKGGVPVLWTAVEYTDPSMADAGLFWLKAKTLAVWQIGSELHSQGLADWVNEDLTPSEGDAVVGSACGDRSEEIQKANLFDLNSKYADVVTEAEAIEHLQTGW
ncbi:hypothetical protein K4K54_003461 [Colletotrichum sp. SAR 10_86]|nr:hypothetical protein K4K50_001864 [Colletotrichum sp. SAR 10_71]KAI8238324.1 hypothetical protein K4K54_003461 [Colletotrichum sp. SAR 10_86]